ncbi:DUF6221 family protein [Streptomyces sp. NPDC002853]
MSEIADFLRARYAERRALALSASPGPWHVNEESDEVLAMDGIAVAEGFALSGRQLRATTEHIAANDPVDVIADCDAKLALVDLHAPDSCGGAVAHVTCKECSQGYEVHEWGLKYPCRTLRILTRPFAGHPDHKGEEWAP